MTAASACCTVKIVPAPITSPGLFEKSAMRSIAFGIESVNSTLLPGQGDVS